MTIDLYKLGVDAGMSHDDIVKIAAGIYGAHLMSIIKSNEVNIILDNIEFGNEMLKLDATLLVKIGSDNETNKNVN